MAAPIAGFTGVPYYGEVPLTVQFTDLSTGIPTSWLWTYGDGETGAVQNPSHTYTEVGGYTVSLSATNGDGTDTHTIANAISTYSIVSVVEAPGVVIELPSIKYCSSFTCIGWVRSPVVGATGKSIIPLAVSDISGNVRSSEAALYFEVVSEDGDWRLAFKGSKSKLIRFYTGVDLGDGLWHMLAWVCNEGGLVTHYVDGVVCPPESGYGDDGVAFSKPHTTAVRAGKGYVWVPCLDEAGQSVVLYNWRYSSGLVLHGDWVRELMAVDKAALGV